MVCRSPLLITHSSHACRAALALHVALARCPPHAPTRETPVQQETRYPSSTATGQPMFIVVICNDAAEGSRPFLFTPPERRITTRSRRMSLEISACTAESLEQHRHVLVVGSTVHISCTGLISRHGVRDYQRMLQLVSLETDATASHSLLNALPPSNWLHRSAVLTVNTAQPTSNVAYFLRELCATGFLDVGGLENGQGRQQLWRALFRHGRLRSLVYSLPWPWMAQFAELWSGDLQTHVAVARVASSGCNARLLTELDEMRRVLGGSLDGLLTDRRHSGSATMTSSTPLAPAATGEEEAVQHVSAQYEELPYPPRKASDEISRAAHTNPGHVAELREPVHSSLASMAEISHFAFGGRFQRRYCGADRRPFRALIAGGGTGDATVQMAHELADLHQRYPVCAYNRSEIVHLDLSAASVRLASERLRIRGLLQRGRADRSGPALRMVTASLLTLPQLGLGSFDFINLCGVLHHLPDPSGALGMLQRHALAPAGSIGLMVYGALGRRGVYETQAMLRLLHAAGNVSNHGGSQSLSRGRRREVGARSSHGRPWTIGARVADAVELLTSLPQSSPLRRNKPVWYSDEVQLRMGDAGIFDLLLHSTDQPYTRPSLVAAAKAAGLVASGWLQAGMGDPRYWLRACTGAFGPCAAAGSREDDDAWQLLRSRIAALDVEAAAEFAELASGHTRKHWAYFTRHDSRAAAGSAVLPVVGMATGMEGDLAPCVLNVSADTMAALSARKAQSFSVQTLLQGEAMVTRMPPLTSALLSRINCKKPLSELLDELRLETGADEADVWSQWRQLYSQLTAVGGWLFMSDSHIFLV